MARTREIIPNFTADDLAALPASYREQIMAALDDDAREKVRKALAESPAAGASQPTLPPKAPGGPQDEPSAKRDGGAAPAPENAPGAVLEGGSPPVAPLPPRAARRRGAGRPAGARGLVRRNPWSAALVGVVLLLGGTWAGTLWMLPQARTVARLSAQAAAPTPTGPAAPAQGRDLPAAADTPSPTPSRPQTAQPPAPPQPQAPAPPPAASQGDTITATATATPAPSQTLRPPYPAPAGQTWHYGEGCAGWALFPDYEQAVCQGGQWTVSATFTDSGPVRPGTMPLKSRYYTCSVENRVGKDPWCTFTLKEKIEANLP